MRRLSKPSPALVVAIIALVAALAGNAIGKGGGTVTKATVKKVADKRIQQAAPDLAVKSAKTAKTADSAAVADIAGAADFAESAGSAEFANSAKSVENVYTANVNADGTVYASVPQGATANADPGPGSYHVTFPRPVFGCTFAAASGSSSDPTETLTGVRPDPGNPNSLMVFTSNSAGASANRDFYVQMVCPV